MLAFASKTLGTTSLLLLLLQTTFCIRDRAFARDVEEQEGVDEEDNISQQSAFKSTRSHSKPAFTELSGYVWRRLRESAQSQEEEMAGIGKPSPLRFFPVTSTNPNALRLPDFGEERPFSLGAINPLPEMLQLLGGAEAYNMDIMSYNRPWEVDMHPQGSFEFSKRTLAADRQRRGGVGRLTAGNFSSSDEQREMGRLLRRRLTALQRLRNGQARAAHRQSRHTFTMTRLGDADPAPSNLRAQRRKRRQRTRWRGVRLLEEYSTCPVWRTWRDYGPQFWPRWVREGRCMDVAGTSCSWPPGMHCVEAGHTIALILRYICLQAWPLDRCRWYRVPLPLVTSCRCDGCSSTYSRGAGGP
ncbi:unnamed protein product [Schistocephalus solidus]|uniref:Noggin-2 n=1 Tax=Schistocephalus solidus TaxID=70667 RepID=A0A183SLN3_SCHSO|nr:unnamed protein product [Schistocephalus solidus]